jgi:hypothetical protein
MSCVCSACVQQYWLEPPIDGPRISHGVCEECLPGDFARMKRGVAAFRTGLKGRLVSERNRHLPRGFDEPDLL